MAYQWTAQDRRGIWGWLSGRWPDAQDWDADVRTAFFADLAPFPPAVVQTVLARLRDEGREFAPRSPAIVHACRDAVRHPAPARDPRATIGALPPLPGAMSWAEYARRYIGEDISIMEAAIRYGRGTLTLKDFDG